MGLKDRIKKNEVSDKLTDIKITIAGRPKAGKTSLFYEILKREGGLDAGLLLAFEKGYNFLPDINVVDIDSWDTFVEVVDDLVDDNEGFKYLAFDTVDIASKLCEKYVLQKASRKDGKRYEALADIPFGKAYDLLQGEFSEQMTRLEQAGFGLFFITHDKDRTVKEKSGTEYEKTSMSLSGRAGDYVKNSSDFIVFIDIENKKEKVNGKRVLSENRIMRFRGDGTTEAGGRIASIEESIEYDVDNFLATIKEAIRKQAETLRGGKQSAPTKTRKKEEPKVVEPDLDGEPEFDDEAEEPNVIEEVDTEAIEEVKEKIAEYIADMDKDEKKELAKVFKEKLGVVNYQKSDDLEALQEILSDLS